MRCLTLALLLLTGVLLTPPCSSAAAQTEEPAPAQVDPEFAALREAFGLLHNSLRNSGGLADRDRPAVTSFRERVEAFADAHPDHAGAVAMALQLSMWLEDDDRADALWERLMALRPDDSTIALGWLRRRQAAADLDAEQTFEMYRELYERFPGNPELTAAWVRELRQRARYQEAIDLLQAAEPDAAAEPELMFLLGDCLFAEHRFEEGLSTLESIPESGSVPLELRGEVQRIRGYCGEYVDLWAAEQEIRRAEAEADDLPRVRIVTSRGPVVVELFENEAPNTVANFVDLAESGFYGGTRFHRYEPDFMIQGGDPNTKPEGTGTPGQGNPGYLIPDEHTQNDHRMHFHDSVTMAKTSAPNTGGSQFYFNHRPTPWLNGKHTVFGRVVEGLDVARALRKDDEILEVVVVRKRDHEYEPRTLPVE